MSQKKDLVPNQKCSIDFKNEPWFVLQCLQSIFLKHPVCTNFEKKSSWKSQTMSIKSKLLNGLKNVIVYVISSKPPLIEQHVRCTKVLNIQSIMLVYHAILPENKLKCFKSKPVSVGHITLFIEGTHFKSRYNSPFSWSICWWYKN